MRMLIVACVLAMVTGCGSRLGLNFQRSALRGTGDLAVTTQLELTSEGSVENDRAKIKKYAEELLKFLDTGKVKELPLEELDAALRKIVPLEFMFIVDGLLGYIDAQTVDIDGKIGEDNVKRIRAFLRGVIAGAGYYDVKDKKPDEVETDY